MPRIRTLKPEFWGDEKLAPLPPIDRLVFLGLISMADDEGRLVDSVKTIDGFLFPASEDSARLSLQSLETLRRISRGCTESGQAIIQVVNWKRHQRVPHPSPYSLPRISRESHDPIFDLRARSTNYEHDLRTPIVEEEAAASSARERFLQTVPNRPTWEGEIRAIEDGMGRGVSARPEQVNQACADYLANHDLAKERPNIAEFRAYVGRTVKADAIPREASPAPSDPESCPQCAARRVMAQGTGRVYLDHAPDCPARSVAHA